MKFLLGVVVILFSLFGPFFVGSFLPNVPVWYSVPSFIVLLFWFVFGIIVGSWVCKDYMEGR